MELQLTAIIPCAGQGIRLRPFTSDTPKPLIPIENTTPLQHTLNWLVCLGVERVVLVIGKADARIPNQIGRSCKEIEIVYARQSFPVGLLNALLTARDLVRGSFLVILGDELYVDSDHRGMISFHQTHDGLPGICGYVGDASWEMIQKNYSLQFGPGGQIVRIVEKPREYVNAVCGTGSWLLEPSFFDYAAHLHGKGYQNVASALQMMIDDGHTILGYNLGGQYVNINTVADIGLAKTILSGAEVEHCESVVHF